jgi:hypothetical protein
VASEWSIGASLPFPGRLLPGAGPDPTGNPIVDAAVLYGRDALHVEFPYDPPSFDLSIVLHAVEPDAYFSLSEPGTITLDDQMIARFDPGPSGRHRLLQRPVEAALRTRITHRFVELVTR